MKPLRRQQSSDNERVVAAQCLLDVLVHGRSLSTVLPERVNQEAQAKARIQEMVYGVLRWQRRLDAIVQKLLRKPLKKRDRDIYCLLLLGLYQLIYMRTPEHAAVAETVQAVNVLDKAWAKGLVNAVLRNYLRQPSSWLAALDRNVAVASSHADWLVAQLKQAWPEDYSAILEANNRRPPMSLRVNRSHMTRAAYLQRLDEVGLSAQAHGHVDDALILAEPVDVSRLPGFSNGDVSVQDAAAQLAAPLLDVGPGMRILDACAAPGGKTAHIFEIEPAVAGVWALDHDERRLDRLRENLDRISCTAHVLCGDASQPTQWWDGQLFDRILVDAPCSASGVIRRHPDIKALRRADDIAALQQTQQLILQSLWPLLRPGGKLVYVTCSVLAQENHQQIASFLAEHGDAHEMLIDAAWGRAMIHGRQILPGEAEMDGFYYACLVKRE